MSFTFSFNKVWCEYFHVSKGSDDFLRYCLICNCVCSHVACSYFRPFYEMSLLCDGVCFSSSER